MTAILGSLKTGERFKFLDHPAVWVVVDAAPGGPAVRVMQESELNHPFGGVNTVRTDHPRGVPLVKTATLTPTADTLILNALRAVHGPESIADLRAAVPALDAVAFDVALLALADANRVLLFVDIDPASLSPARRALLLTEGSITYSTAMAR